MLLNKILLQKYLFIIPLLLIPQLCPETSAFEPETELTSDEKPIMVIKNTTFTDDEITKIDSLIEQIPQYIRDEITNKYTGLMDRVFEEIGYYTSDPDLWKTSEAYKEFMVFTEPLGLGVCPFFFKNSARKIFLLLLSSVN